MLHLTNSDAFIALLVLLYTAVPNISAIRYGRCDSQFEGNGTCVQLSECQFILDIISVPSIPPEMLKKVQDSQCGSDNTFKGADRYLVCCPDKYLKESQARIERQQRDGNVLPSAGECGNKVSNFIYGGNETGILDYPWMALLRYRSRTNELEFLCGGSLLNTRYVLTAAHCTVRSQQRVLHSVRLGEWDIRTNPDCEVDINGVKSCAPEFIELGIEKIISHPRYVSGSNDQFFDIALLRLEKSVAYTNFIRPICLPGSTELCGSMFVNSTMEVAGWGATNKPKAASSPVKMAISVGIWETDKCQNIYKTSNRIIDGTHHLCAGGVSGIDACRGDSGGPLMLQELINHRYIYFVTGVISFGPKPCGYNGWPGVYARVGNYVEWIRDSLEP
uniref:CLIP domain-containing serine protease n=1 Tax=Zeugodacus cucurbitae TaxID=28588 RepID=A0A0A1WHE6_ZEUCU